MCNKAELPSNHNGFFTSNVVAEVEMWQSDDESPECRAGLELAGRLLQNILLECLLEKTNRDEAWRIKTTMCRP